MNANERINVGFEGRKVGWSLHVRRWVCGRFKGMWNDMSVAGCACRSPEFRLEKIDVLCFGFFEEEILCGDFDAVLEELFNSLVVAFLVLDFD